MAEIHMSPILAETNSRKTPHLWVLSNPACIFVRTYRHISVSMSRSLTVCRPRVFLRVCNHNYRGATNKQCVCFWMSITQSTIHVYACVTQASACVCEWASLLSPVVMPASLRRMRSVQCHGSVSSPLASQEESRPATELSALQRTT